MRSFKLLLAFLAMSLLVQTAGAQRATLAVTARILPSVDAMAAGTIAPGIASGHTVVASAQLSDIAAAPASARPSAAPGFVEFKLGMAIAANVQYQVAVSSNANQLEIRRQVTRSRQEISYRIPAVVGSQPPVPVVVTLTAASIS